MTWHKPRFTTRFFLVTRARSRNYKRNFNRVGDGTVQVSLNDMKLIKRLLVALALLIVGLFSFVFLASTKERPPPDRLAGYIETRLEVAHRDVSLPVHIWYPAQQGPEPELLGQNALFYGHHVLRDAPFQGGPAPVVVMSHGSGGNAVGLGWLASELALRGLIVIATNHPGTTSRDSDPFQTVKVWERPQDMTALLDYVATARHVTADMDRVGALGFSLGGHSVLSLAGERVSKAMFIAYCDRNAGLIDCGWMQAAGVDFTAIDAELYEKSNLDDRVGAVVAIDPALPQAVPEDGLDDLTAAALILNLGTAATVPPAMRADALAARIASADYAEIPGARHFSMLAECSLMGRVVIGLAGDDNICSDTGLRPRADVHKDLLGQILPFLTQELSL